MLGRPLMLIQFLGTRLAERLRGEDGIAMPAVLMMVIAGLAMGGAAVTASVGAQKTSTRDQASKEALAAADAGMQQALYRQNKVVVSESLPCVIAGLAGDLLAGAALSDGWCPPITGSVGDASFTYRVKPATLVGTLQNEREVRVVSIGTSGDVSRRIAENARSKTGLGIFSGGDLVGLDSLNMNPSSDITGDVGSNGNVVQGGGSLCGNVTYGYGMGFTQGGTWCPGYGSGEGEFNMPPPLQGTVPPSAGGQNSNGRMFAGSGCIGSLCDTKTGNISWNPTTRVLALNGSETVTLGGSLPYSLCRLDMEGNSTLIAAQGASVRIFFDSPENCAPPNGDSACPSSYKQVDVRGNAKVFATSSDPKDLSFLFVGSNTCPTNSIMSGNAKSINEVILYGPRTDMQLHGNSSLSGAMTGKTVVTGGSATFLADPDVTDWDVDVALQYQRDRYVECIGPVSVAPPDANC
jgi:type II secretory pathway pseudopilin PulG